jgi:hypothetical protein
MAERNTAIYGDQLDATVVGLGMVKDTTDDFTHKLKVDVDGSTLGFTGNAVEVVDDGITKEKINSDVAGVGIVQNVDGSLEINVDDSTLEIASGEVLQVKDDGITEAKLDMFNTPTVGYYMKYTANGMEWADLDTDAVLESDLIFYEVPTGTINSVNTSFTLANTPVAGTVQVFLNGLLQAPGGLDFTVSGTTLTFVKAPRTSSDLYVHYVVT